MFLLSFSFQFGELLPAALLGMAFALIAFVILFSVLRLCGFRLLWRRKARIRRERSKEPVPVTTAPVENEIPEEELIVILTAAALEALGATDTKRFRVVAFKRI